MLKRRGEIVAVKDLFEKYRKILHAPQKTVEIEAIKVIGEISNLKLREDQVEFNVKTKVLFIKASGLIKQEIKIKNNLILIELKKSLGGKSSPTTIL